VVSSALELMKSIIEARYPLADWNIYGAQASDGDNWPDDNQRCVGLMETLLPMLQYYAYIEITSAGDRTLWKTYQQVQAAHPEAFAMRHITGPADIYPVFHELSRCWMPARRPGCRSPTTTGPSASSSSISSAATTAVTWAWPMRS
jgi:uncharacterized sporulation protein YeaH/YhbH (DUF444 family)